MAECNSSKEINAYTGGNDFYISQLYTHLKISISRAKKIDIIVSFLMQSGVELLIEDLEWAIGNHIPIRLLTGTYLDITQPEALYSLRRKFGKDIDIRFYDNPNHSFHPKSYIFETDIENEVYIGSSNISKGALTNSIEWNYRFTDKQDKESVMHFKNAFNNLFEHHSVQVTDEVLDSYSKNWKRKTINYTSSFFAQDNSNSNTSSKFENKKKVFTTTTIPTPQGPQIEALYKLEKMRKEGYDKALVIAATGIGKTYLAAFDSINAKRVLFVAHRQEIIKQAALSFEKIRGAGICGLFYSEEKQTKSNVICALVETLGNKKYLSPNYFFQDNFDYIIIDEFHHAVSDNYKNIINYFKPKFLLGLTATPERLDGQDIYSLCDFNVAYEIRLQEAINKEYLCPFDYYGIYDDTVQYDEIDWKNGKYNQQELEKALMITRRFELIYKNYKKYSSTKVLGFCSSVEHAKWMAKEFSNVGIPSCSVHSGVEDKYSLERSVAIESLKIGKIKIIFSVDMFNEGVDIPCIDMVMFLRPTESPTVFLQQLGRGLRLSENKNKVIVLDFIGNYKKASIVPSLLTGKPFNKKSSTKKNILPKEIEIPYGCHIDFDFQLVDIFERQIQNSLKLKEKVLQHFLTLSEQLQKVPSRLNFFNSLDDELLFLLKKNSKENPLKDWIQFLYNEKMLTDEEQQLFVNNTSVAQNIGHTFLTMIETTSMTKSYKMPILLAFYNEGNIKLNISSTDIYNSFVSFYNIPTNTIDMQKDSTTKDFLSWNKEKIIALALKNPLHAFANTHKNFFTIQEDGSFSLTQELLYASKSSVFASHIKDAISYRLADYYERNNSKSDLS